MNTAGEATDWRVLREFVAVDLEQSFVLSWEMDSGTLLIDIDLHLLPNHTLFEKPRPSEKVCIHPAVIEFPLCNKITSGSCADEIDPVSAAAGLGLGAIMGLQRFESGDYEICGKFGTVRIEAERPILRLKEL
jgi:hypothetical protein